jgi:hypothetical protein
VKPPEYEAEVQTIHSAAGFGGKVVHWRGSKFA